MLDVLDSYEIGSADYRSLHMPGYAVSGDPVQGTDPANRSSGGRDKGCYSRLGEGRRAEDLAK